MTVEFKDFESIDWTDPEVRSQLWSDSRVLQELISSGLVDAETASQVQLGLGGRTWTDPTKPHPYAEADSGSCYLCGGPKEDIRHHRVLDLREAISEVWTGIDDLSSLAATLDPEDQLEEGEVEAGMTAREDRYRWAEAHAVISTAFDRALRLADAAGELLAAEVDIVGGGDVGSWADLMADLGRRLEDFGEAFGTYVPDAGAVRCVGCPCIEQGGSLCCFCGGDPEAHG